MEPIELSAILRFGNSAYKGRVRVHDRVNTGDRRGYREAHFAARTHIPVVPGDIVLLSISRASQEYQATVGNVHIRSDERGITSAIMLRLEQGRGANV